MKISGTIFIFLMGVLMTAAAQVDELISDLVDGGKVARREAARSLALIGPEAKAAVPALARALDDDEVQDFEKMLDKVGFRYDNMTDNEAYQLFLGQGNARSS